MIAYVNSNQMTKALLSVKYCELVIYGEVNVHIGKEINAAHFDNKQRNELLRIAANEMRSMLE